MKVDDTILVTGANGLVGHNLVSELKRRGFRSLLTPGSQDCDLSNQAQVDNYFEKSRPAYVFHMAGRVRGLGGNMHDQGAAYLDNLRINTNVVEASRKSGVKKIVAMGTVAMYPDPPSSMPFKEEEIWMGVPHRSEYGYAQAKRAMLAQLEAYHDNYGMPYAVAISTNLYGPFDRFNPLTGHVIPSLIKKFFDALENHTPVEIWGDGSAQRDFLHVCDTVTGLLLIMEAGEGVINLASGQTSRIRDVVRILTDITKMHDRVRWDTSKPNGQVSRAYDISKLRDLGFSCQYDLVTGITETYKWYQENQESARVA
jgi:GDP-L-fucose synthase